MAKTVNERAEEIMLKVISLLDEPERLVILPVVIRKLEKHLELIAHQGEIVSAVPLDKEYIAKIEVSLEKKLHEKIVLKNKVDKSILGGIIIRFRDLVIDQSLRRQLRDIKEEANEI